MFHVRSLNANLLKHLISYRRQTGACAILSRTCAETSLARSLVQCGQNLLSINKCMLLIHVKNINVFYLMTRYFFLFFSLA